MNYPVIFILFCSAPLLSLCEKYVSDAELKAWSERLFASDVNNIGNFVTVQFQGRSKPNSTDDYAPLPLLRVDQTGLKGPTISKLPSLYNNFIPDSLMDEVVTPEEVREQSNFIDAVFNTTVFKITHDLLRSKDLAPVSEKTFRDNMYNLWFKLYSRGKHKLSSSAFEHIFLGEIKNNQISGFHNWLYYYFLESKKLVNYLGWIKKVELPNQKGYIVKMHFLWGQHSKPVGSIFIGTSPELELSVYTICFLARPNNKCNLSFGGKTFHIQTYTFTQNNVKLISSAYPNV